ncbi:DUF2953 domain-containing protein [Halanaerobaculum tunisiense]
MLKLLLLISFGLLTLLYLLPIKLEIDFKRQNEKDNCRIELDSLLFSHKLELSYLQLQSILYPFFVIKGQLRGLLDRELLMAEELEKDELEKIINYLDKIEGIINRIEPISLLTSNCTYFLWRTRFGFSNPALTGMLAGTLWSLKGAVVGSISNVFTFNTLPTIAVEPNFDQVEPVQFEIKGIFKFRLGNIILIGARILFEDFKRRLQHG